MSPNSSPRRGPGWAGFVALALVPLLAVAALIGLAKPSEAEVHAAIVNLDEAVTVNGQYVPMGRQLAAAMLERDGDNISWTLADAPTAAARLKTGRYSAVVTIPKGFSAAATSFSANDAASAKQATIQVSVGSNSPITDAQLAQEISALAVDTINATLTESYLDGIYVGFNTVGEQFTTIVDGAKQLQDGSAKLAEGTRAASQGANQLSGGLTQLKDGGAQLADGGAQLVTGLGTLKAGTGELAKGTSELASGVTQLETGADQLAAGVDQFAAQTPELVAGVGELADGADQLLTQVPAFADGAAQAIGGVSQIRVGLDQFIAQVGQPGGAGDLGGLQQLVDGANGVSGGLSAVDQAMQAYASGAQPAPAEVQGIGSQIAGGAIAQFSCPEGTPAELCAQLAGAFAAGANAVADPAVKAGFQAGTGAASAALNTPQNGSSLIGGAQQLAGGVETLASSIGAETEKQKAELVAGLTAVRDGVVELETQAAPIVAGAPALGAGATQLLGGINQLNDQIVALPAGVNQLADGARQLADGVGELNSGATQLAAGTAALDAGIPELQAGAQAYVDGVGTYVDGVGSAADGAVELSAGLVELSGGVDQLSAGIATFATELAKGADQVPSYSQDDRKRLSEVVASPVERGDALLESGQAQLVALLLTVGLWLAALAGFVVVAPVPRNVITSRASSLALWAGTLWKPAAIVGGQALVLGIVGGATLGVGAGTTLGLIGLLALLGISFVLANHALAAWFGNLGRGVSVLLLVATVGLALSSTLGWLSPLGVVSPLHNGFTLTRTWLGGGSGEIGIASVSVLMFVIAAAASYLSVALRRQISVDRYRRSMATAA